MSKEKHPVFRVTEFSKYFALTLFVAMPFVGGWIGYTYAPEKVVNIEKIKVIEVDKEVKVETVEGENDFAFGNVFIASVSSVQFGENGYELFLGEEYKQKNVLVAGEMIPILQLQELRLEW